MLANFAVFILSHGRPDRVLTYSTLKRRGYTGKIFIIVDDLDKTREQYIEKFGAENVIVFDKQAVANTTDQGDNFNDLRSTTHVRNAIFDAAEQVGVEYFIQLDDDYTAFNHRFDAKLDYAPTACRNLDTVFSALLRFFEVSGADSIALAQGGDFIGGAECTFAEATRRKCMNSFICSTKRRFQFFSRLNEDVNTYLVLGSRGRLFFTVNQVSLVQLQTQTNSGGMTDSYLKYGTYVKSFYSVMYHPSSVKVRKMSGRLHHSISWKHTVPMILREEHRRI